MMITNWKSRSASLYHSSYGKTMDELMKPELLAHAIWIAAPILPGTKEQQESEQLHRFYPYPNEELCTELQKNNVVLQINDINFASRRCRMHQRINIAAHTNLQIYFAALYAC